jgi:hypothetical protein
MIAPRVEELAAEKAKQTTENRSDPHMVHSVQVSIILPHIGPGDKVSSGKTPQTAFTIC